MECAFLKVGSDDPCHKKPVKDSQYCAMHKFLMKNSNVKACLRCGKRTYSKVQICNRCDGNKLSIRLRYCNVIRPFRSECKRLRNINID